MAANHRRSWLARRVAVEVRSAKRSPWLFDAVLHLAAGTVEFFIEMAGAGLGAGQRGHDEAGIVLAWGVLRLGDNPTPAAPAVQGAPQEVLEPPRRLAGRAALRGGLGEFGGDLVDQPVIARQT